MAIINMQTMRYINLLDRASHVKTSKCFVYNNTIMFAVPKEMVSKAIGPDAINVRRIQEVLLKNGYSSLLEDCGNLWDDYSDSYAAGWLGLPEDDGDLWNILENRI